jgi:thymidylate kinase
MRHRIITKFFTDLEKNYQYSILHHANKVFSEEDDIDFVVACNKNSLKKFIVNFVKDNKLFLFNLYSIDVNIYRFDISFSENGVLQHIELDCCCSGFGSNLQSISPKALLQNSEKVLVNGSNFNKISNIAEFLYFVRKKAFKKDPISHHVKYLTSLVPNTNIIEIQKLYDEHTVYFSSLKYKSKVLLNKAIVLSKRFFEPNLLTIAFLGPDGAGKSTIIDGIMNGNFFINKYYFHLKPLCNEKQGNNEILFDDPHQHRTYSESKSYFKLLYFIGQYNLGWLKNIFPKRFKSSPIIIFDRYFDDIFVDHKRYRYGGKIQIAKVFKRFIPSPDITFILTAEPSVIYSRKKEVKYEELERQVGLYRKLGAMENFFNINVDAKPDDIVLKINNIIMEKMNERF